MGKKICIVLAILWMSVIFYLSNQPGIISSNQSGNVVSIISELPLIGDIMKYLISINMDGFIVRKIAHMFLYFILAMIVFIVVNKDNIKKSAIISFLITFLYACGDEFHQMFVSGRSCEFRDVMIDSLGAIIGILIISFVYKCKSCYNRNKLKN